MNTGSARRGRFWLLALFVALLQGYGLPVAQRKVTGPCTLTSGCP
jgi:hypothetical protein